MLTKYEELKIASIIIGKSMKQICKAESSEIRDACIDSSSNIEITQRIDSAINEANQKWNGFYYAKKKVTEQIA